MGWRFIPKADKGDETFRIFQILVKTQCELQHK